MNKQGEGVKHLEVLESETGGCVVLVGMTYDDWYTLQVTRGNRMYGKSLPPAMALKLLITEALKGVKHP